MSLLKDLKEWVERLNPANPDATRERYDRIVSILTEEERIALARAIDRAFAECKDSKDEGCFERCFEAWLSTIPQEQRAHIMKVLNQVKPLERRDREE